MEKRFANLFNLTEAAAIALLDTPQDQLAEDDSRYVAAAHLANFPTEKSIEALIRAVGNTEASLDNRIVRRKSVESLGKLQARQALPAICACLADENGYTVENAVWAIGEIGTQDPNILEEIARLLEKPGQTYRVIIHTLAKLNYQPALERIRKFIEVKDELTVSAAVSAVCRLSGDYTSIEKVVSFLAHPNVYARRLSIQDLVDAKYYPAIPQIARCPVSLVFRLRGIRLLAEVGIPAKEITFADIRPSLDRVIEDRPDYLEMVHQYDRAPDLAFLIQEIYQTDFGRCYLATKTLLEREPETTAKALMKAYEEEARNDYGANYHALKALGWLKYTPARDLFLEALQNREPQFQKSRTAAAIALGELGDRSVIPALKANLEDKIWDLKYATLIALEKLGDASGREIAANDEDWLIRALAMSNVTTDIEERKG
jgi:bilin biosynthesis protein